MKNNKLIRHVLIVGAITLILASCAKSTVSQGFDWPQWRGPTGNGVSTETEWNPKALENGPNVVRRTNIGSGYSNVAVKGNRLYAIGNIGEGNAIFCFNAETGKKYWHSPFKSNGASPQSTPTIDGDFLYALSADGFLLCLKTKNGKIQWQRNIVEEFQVRAPFYGFAGSPVIEGDLIILTSNTFGTV